MFLALSVFAFFYWLARTTYRLQGYNEKRVNVKLTHLDGRYCYAKCLDGYYPPAGFSTKMTKITCKCPDAKGCEWQPQKPFIGCVGPCEQPLREFGSIKSFFKVKADYSQGIDIHREGNGRTLEQF